MVPILTPYSDPDKPSHNGTIRTHARSSRAKKVSNLSNSERLEAYSRLFRFETYEDIDVKDFAEKTGMSVMSVNSMIRHAKLNAKLYEEMVGLGYLDKSFPVWWYSPAREGTEAKTVEQPRTTLEEGEQIEGTRTELEEGEGYEPTPPDTPAPKEGRPALPDSSLSSSFLPASTEGFDVVPTSSSFSDAELSLLQDRAITEITPGQWMHTQEQADGRIVLMCTRDNGTIYVNSKVRTTTI